MNPRMLAPLLLLVPILSNAQVCGDLHARPNSKDTSVALQSKPTAPEFYYREGVDYVIFISEESLMGALAERERLGDPMVKRLLPLVRAHLPLKEDHDLYYFNLFDWLFYDSIRRAVALSIGQGDAAIVDATGAWLSTVTVSRQQKARISTTRIYADVKKKSLVLSLIDCIAD